MRYQLCREFGWTPQQLDEAPHQDVADFALILNYHAQKTRSDDNRRPE